MCLYTSITKLAMVNCLNTCHGYCGSSLSLPPSSCILFSHELFFFFASVPSNNLQCMIAKPDLVLTAVKVRVDLATVMSVKSFSASTQSRQIW